MDIPCYNKIPSDDRFKIGMKVSYKGKTWIITAIKIYRYHCPTIYLEGIYNKDRDGVAIRETINQLKIVRCAEIVHSF